MLVLATLTGYLPAIARRGPIPAVPRHLQTDDSPMSYHAPGFAFGAAPSGPRTDAPLVLLFERDDAMAVPLLSQLRVAGYDVRAARTPVDLFDAAQKHAVALIVVDLSNATASRREFWVALDAQRRGSATQVLTFRVVTPNGLHTADADAVSHALADLEIGGPYEVPLLVEAVARRVPLSGVQSGPATPSHGVTGAHSTARPWRQDSTSPFASPAAANPFTSANGGSPFDQPDTRNPFAQTHPRPQQAHSDGSLASPYASPPDSPMSGAGWPAPAADRGASFARMPAMPFTFPAPLGTSLPFPARGDEPAPAPYFAPPPVADAWMPPDGAALPPEHSALAPAAPPIPGTEPQQAGRDMTSPVHDGLTEPRMPSADHHPAPSFVDKGPVPDFVESFPQAGLSTAPAAARPTAATGRALIRPEERALGAVLVEGALVSSERLEVLAEIRNMLTTVDVDIKLGELALLFRFLSPDQLLAALLVSRRLITPEQIAALGRIKQEMGASGINYDLETLLVMFNIMSRDELDRLRSELA